MTDNGRVSGVIGSIPRHKLTEEQRKKPMEIKNMLIDIGADDEANVAEIGIRPGQPIVPICPFTPMANPDKILAKAWDNRYGCGLAIELLKELQHETIPNQLFSGATVQEEVGLRGAQVAAHMIEPDLFYALDASPANDMSGKKTEFGQLGEGALLRIFDRTMITHQGMREFILETAESNDIAYQYFVSQGGPETVANFLEYVESGTYEHTFFHRLIPGFILQGGGYQYDFETEDLARIEAKPPVVNEPKFSNRRGTIAMAKRPHDPNSATIEWFINLSHNHTNLDVQNGGFTVFGEVIGDGMEVVDALAKIKVLNFGGAFTDLPVRDYDENDGKAGEKVTDEHLVMVHNIMILDHDPDSAADLKPVPNTLIHEQPEKPNKSSSSGSVSWWLLGMLLLSGLALRKRG